MFLLHQLNVLGATHVVVKRIDAMLVKEIVTPMLTA